jgi:hypothetical protein
MEEESRAGAQRVGPDGVARVAPVLVAYRDCERVSVRSVLAFLWRVGGCSGGGYVMDRPVDPTLRPDSHSAHACPSAVGLPPPLPPGALARYYRFLFCLFVRPSVRSSARSVR